MRHHQHTEADDIHIYTHTHIVSLNSLPNPSPPQVEMRPTMSEWASNLAPYRSIEPESSSSLPCLLWLTMCKCTTLVCGGGGGQKNKKKKITILAFFYKLFSLTPILTNRVDFMGTAFPIFQFYLHGKFFFFPCCQQSWLGFLFNKFPIYPPPLRGSTSRLHRN